MVKIKVSTAQKKPAVKKATTKPRGKKALLPARSSRSPNVEVAYDTSPCYQQTSQTQNGRINPPLLESFSMPHNPSSTFFHLQSNAAGQTHSTNSQDARPSQTVQLVAQDESPRSQSSTPNANYQTFSVSHSEKPSYEPEVRTGTVIDWRSGRDAGQTQTASEPVVQGRTVRFCDNFEKGKKRERVVGWEQQDPLPMNENSSTKKTSRIRYEKENRDKDNESKAERKRRKGKARAKEVSDDDEDAPHEIDESFTTTSPQQGKPHIIYTAPDPKNSGIATIPYSTFAAPFGTSPTQQFLPGISSFGTYYAGVNPGHYQAYPQNSIHLPPLVLPPSNGYAPTGYRQLYPCCQSGFQQPQAADSTLHPQNPNDVARYPATDGQAEFRDSQQALPVPPTQWTQSGMSTAMPVAEGSSSSSTCVSEHGTQNVDGGKHCHDKVSRPSTQQARHAPYQSQTLASNSSSNIDPAIIATTSTLDERNGGTNFAVKIEPGEQPQPGSMGPPMYPAYPVPMPVFAFPPGHASQLDYLVHRTSPLCPLEELDFAFYFACCWDGQESMIRSTCALYQQWVSASLQRTEDLVEYFFTNQQLILMRIGYFRKMRQCRLTFNPANRKCDNCFGTSPTLPLPRKEKPSFKHVRLCKDCGGAMYSLQEDGNQFRMYTVERRRIVGLHEEGIRKQLKELGFPVDGPADGPGNGPAGGPVDGPVAEQAK